MGFLLIFDMDGTLIDSERSIVRCLRESTRKFGFEIGEVARYIGVLKLTQILSKYGVPSNHIPAIMESYVECYRRTFARDTKPIGNSQSVLKQLQKNNELGILTLKNLDLTVDITKHFFQGVNFKFIVGGDLPLALENKVEGLRFIKEKSGRKPGEIYYIGDRATDVKSANEAGMKAVWVTFGLGKASDFDFQGDYETAGSFDDLLDIFSSQS